MRKFYFLLLGLMIFTGVQAQIVNIPDANFKAKLLETSENIHIAVDSDGNSFKIDANNDGEIQLSEVQNVIALHVPEANISSLEGISSFSNLGWLECSYNQLTSLESLNLENLKHLYCRGNQFTSLDSSDFSGIPNLEEFDCSNNNLTSINTSKCVNLNDFQCSFNQLTSLDVSDNINLGNVLFNNNLLTSLDFSTNRHFEVKEFVEFGSNFYVNNNLLTSIIFPKSVPIDSFNFNISNNFLVTVEFPVCKYGGFYNYGFQNNPNITTVLSKNLILEEYRWNFYTWLLDDFPNLKYICAVDDDISYVEDLILEKGNTNCQVNSYCSFVPGGEYYIIQGNTKFDSSNNGCDVTDSNFPNLNFSITDSTITRSSIANTTGNYAIPVQAGTQTITPVLENPSYFNVSPTSLVVTFPTQMSPFTQDFCVIANGIHPDLEVTILSMNRARQGFDASYKIIYQNKGNQTQSGAVKLTFNDAVLDLVTANPVVNNQNTNTISWDFSDLKPFETREIEVTLNVNSPMETPAVNNNDILSYTATIASAQTDETPTDNTFTLNQTVVNSFDPNDKTCLEGATIPPSAVGKYVHYMIRFENKGTAEAQNVVVKDMIDTSKFDISSLVVTQGSPIQSNISKLFP